MDLVPQKEVGVAFVDHHVIQFDSWNASILRAFDAKTPRNYIVNELVKHLAAVKVESKDLEIIVEAQLPILYGQRSDVDTFFVFLEGDNFLRKIEINIIRMEISDVEFIRIKQISFKVVFVLVKRFLAKPINRQERNIEEFLFQLELEAWVLLALIWFIS